jgi:hypothetical protein
MQARHGLDTGFGRRASHAGSGEKYIKFVKCCLAAAYRVLSTRLPRTVRRSQPSYKTSAVSLYPSLRSVRFGTAARDRLRAGKADIPRQLYPVRHFLPPASALLRRRLSSIPAL